MNAKLNGYVIVSDVPLPTRAPSKYPFADMNVGDSFTASAKDKRNVRVAAHNYAHKHKVKFVSRVDGDTLRVWRFK